jgi:hypothetical protein
MEIYHGKTVELHAVKVYWIILGDNAAFFLQYNIKWKCVNNLHYFVGCRLPLSGGPLRSEIGGR